MKTKAAVLLEAGKPSRDHGTRPGRPRPRRGTTKYTGGISHLDLHPTDGDLLPRYPIVTGGHEGSGIIEEVGPGVTKVKPGDHVVCSFIPNCGTRYCATGQIELCEKKGTILEGSMPDGSSTVPQQFRRNVHAGYILRAGDDLAHLVVKDDWATPRNRGFVGCGVPSGWGTAVAAGGVRARTSSSSTASVVPGINAVQGAVQASTWYVVVVDLLAFKRETALVLWPPHAFATADEAAAKVNELSWGQGADQALILVGTVDEEVVAVVNLRRGSRRAPAVITGPGPIRPN